jgi:hypothetical protein
MFRSDVATYIAAMVGRAHRRAGPAELQPTASA